MARNLALIRTLSIVRDLQRGQYGLAVLASRYGVTPRTIRRDLEAIEAAGIRLEKQRDDRDSEWRILAE